MRIDTLPRRLSFGHLRRHTRMIPRTIQARNTLRLQLWADDVFAHNWLCHHWDNSLHEDGCDKAPNQERAEFYTSDLELSIVFEKD